MHIKIDKSALAHELSLLTGIVERKTSIPILSNVLLRTNGQTVEMEATDLNRGLACALDAEVIEGGAVTVPARRLSDYVRLLPDGQVSIAADAKSWVTVKAGRARSRIPGTDITAFPVLPAPQGVAATMEFSVFAALLGRVRYAISKEESRFTLGGAMIEIQADAVRAVATDGHRMALAEKPMENAGTMRFLMPTSAIDAMSKLDGDKLTIQQAENHLFFSAGGRRLTCAKLAGTFPDYARIMPKWDDLKPVIADRAELSTAVTRVAQFADSRSQGIRLTLSPDEISLGAAQADAGESTETVECLYSGATVDMGFNASYIADALAACGTQDVRIFVRNSTDSTEIRPVGDDAYRVVIMPMRV